MEANSSGSQQVEAMFWPRAPRRVTPPTPTGRPVSLSNLPNVASELKNSARSGLTSLDL